RDFELTQVSAFARDHRPSRIGGYKLRAVVAVYRVRRRFAVGEVVPMFIISGNESPPTLGVLWQLVQVPMMIGWPWTSLNPGTTEISMGKVLNNTSPRATDCCAAALDPLADAQLVYRVNALGVNAAPVLIPGEKGWVERNTGPPFAPCAVRSPA